GIRADDHGHLALRQIRRECRQLIVLVLRPAEFDRYVVAVDEPGFLQAVTECRYPVNGIGSRAGIKETNHRYRRSLPPRRARPCGYSAAEKCDEVPPPHGAYPKAKDHGRSIAGLGVGQWRASQ